MKRAALVLSFLAVVAFLAAPARHPRARAVVRAAEPERALFGSYPTRNMVSEEAGLPSKWDVKTGTNIKWSQATGSQTYAGPVVADGKVFLGTNNEGERNPKIKGDKGVVMAFKADTGEFLWQMVTDKLSTGRVNDWPQQGVCSTPFVEGKRLYYTSNQAHIVCLSTEGLKQGKNEGITTEKYKDDIDGDVIWEFDLMGELDVFPHNLAASSPIVVGDMVYVTTANGVDESHVNIPSPKAPSFIALDKNTGKLVWESNLPGENIIHGNWSNASFGTVKGKPQVVFGGGDGWVYSFDVKGEDGKAKLLWKFDANPKKSLYVLGGRATRNHIIGTPTIYDGKVYVAVGEDPEHGEGEGHLWCIDPTKRGDVSPELVYNKADPSKPIPHKRLQALVPEEGDFAKPNPNSAVVWHYGAGYLDKDFGKKKDGDDSDKTPEMHRTIGSATIKNDLLYIVDFSGYIHCLDAKTGALHWTEDMLAASWGSPLIVEDKVYIGNEEGDVFIFALSKEKKQIGKVNCGSSVYTSPVVANNTLYITNRKDLFAIQEGAQTDPSKLKGEK